MGYEIKQNVFYGKVMTEVHLGLREETKILSDNTRSEVQKIN